MQNLFYLFLLYLLLQSTIYVPQGKALLACKVLLFIRGYQHWDYIFSWYQQFTGLCGFYTLNKDYILCSWNIRFSLKGSILTIDMLLRTWNLRNKLIILHKPCYVNNILAKFSGLTNDNQKQELTFWALNKVAYFLEAGGEYDADLFRGTSLSFKVLSNDWDLLKNNQIWLHDIDKRIVRTILFLSS